MSAAVFVLGGGDVGLRMADGLLHLAGPAQDGGIRRLVVADSDQGRVAPAVAMLDGCHAAAVDFAPLDAGDPRALERALRAARPDLIVQAASPISPWAIIGRDHPVARALASAGIALQLPAQLPLVATLMKVVREAGLAAPVANVSMPDLIHPVLATLGLAPTIGLGNASILLLRAKAAQKHRDPDLHPGARPLLRVIGHHNQVYGVMQACPPEDESLRARVYIGEEGRRDDALAYEGPPVPTGPAYNVITAAAALPLLAALLPGAAPLRFSAPAPEGLPGGYPVRIEDGTVSLDLPAGADLEEATAFNRRLGAEDGLAGMAATGEVTFTEKAQAAVSHIDPRLAEPFDPWDGEARARLLLETVRAMGPL